MKILFIKTEYFPFSMFKALPLSCYDQVAEFKNSDFRKAGTNELDLEGVFCACQNDCSETSFGWSPQGHRSMSVGDIIKADGKMYVVSGVGFQPYEPPITDFYALPVDILIKEYKDRVDNVCYRYEASHQGWTFETDGSYDYIEKVMHDVYLRFHNVKKINGFAIDGKRLELNGR